MVRLLENLRTISKESCRRGDGAPASLLPSKQNNGVIPAHAGIQSRESARSESLDTGFRRYDGC